MRYLIFILACASSWGQVETYGHKANSATTVDMSAALSSRPVPEKASDPGTCTEGMRYYNTTSHKGRICTGADTWADEGGSGGSAGDIIIEATFDGGGVAVSTSAITYRRMWAACTVAEWSVFVVGGTATVDVVRIADGTTLPTASIVGAGTKPNVATGGALRAAPSSWTSTAISANDILAFKPTAATATLVQISLRCTR